MERIVIFGATSGIARAVARAWARRGRALLLIGRDQAALAAEASDLRTRHGIDCATLAWDLAEPDAHAARFAEMLAGTEPEGVFFAAGVMDDEDAYSRDPALVRRTFGTNLTEAVIVLNGFAEIFRNRGRGFISALSSVAGDRGRAGNKTYGASKAGLSAWLEGLRASLHGTGVLVQTVKPGPVRTPMTAEYKGPGILLAKPERVAEDIVRGVERGRTTVYTPGYWRFVMAIIRALPEGLARKVPG